jgi:ribosome-binding ATPase YchF (GTP1/OBG family)
MIIGLIGKPNAGKSTFFKAVTLKDVKISNVPFTTIEPNVGIGFVISECVCKEFNVECNPRYGKCVKGKRFIPIKLMDVAGLVKDAHKGKGLGNKFLDDLRQADGLIHVVDFSGLTDENGNPTQNYDPENDLIALENEFDLWFEGIVKKAIEKFEKDRNPKKPKIDEYLYLQLSGLSIPKNKIEEVLKKIDYKNTFEFSKYLRKISKPILIAANKMDLKESQVNFERLKDKYELIPTSAEYELVLKTAHERSYIYYLPGNGFEVVKPLDEIQQRVLNQISEFIKKYGSTGVQLCLNKLVFEKLQMIVVYPVATQKLTDTEGNVLPDAFLVKKGTTLKEFAFKIHSEIGEKFICGIDMRTKKKLGADYELKHNDVVQIMFGR